MTSTNTRKYYVTKSGFGYEEGVYTASELSGLSKDAQKHVVPLSVALAQHLIEADFESGEKIEELTLTQGVDAKTGKVKNVRGVEEEKKFIFGFTKKPADDTRLTNDLQSKLSDIKAKQAEESLRSQIAAKKKQLSN